MSQPKFNRAEVIEQAKAAMEETGQKMKEAGIDAGTIADVLSAGAAGLPQAAQKEMGRKLTQGATKEEKAAKARKELAATIKGWEDECEAMKKMSPAQLAVYEPKFVKTFIAPREYIQRKAGVNTLVKEDWNFGTKPGSVSRAGGTLDKRPVKADRYIFPNSTKGALSLGGTDYRFATQVCRALGIDWGRDSAARVLAQAALDAKAGAKVLSVEYTPTEGPSVALKVRAQEVKKLGLLDARPEDK